MHLKKAGFTLAELLVALALLGLIAAFTIPKLIGASLDNKYNGIAKEAIAATAQTWLTMHYNGTGSSNTTAGDIMNNMNYVYKDTNTTIDSMPTIAPSTCTPTYPCIRLHNGAMLQAITALPFGGTSSTNCVIFQLDPDGILTDNTTNNPGKAVKFFIYYDGGVTDRVHVRAGTNSYDAGGGATPSWFTW